MTGGIAALSGPLHGGANTNVMKMLIEIGDEDKIDAWVDNALAEKRKIMGIGHAVYKTEDPRATWLRKYSKHMGEKKGELKWFEMSQEMERVMDREMGRRGKQVKPNVDFFSASVYRMLGFPAEMYTPIFTVARAPGWAAHLLEQYADNRLMRPKLA